MVITQTKPTGEFYDHLLETVAAGVLVLNEDGIVTSANPAAGRILGWESEQLIGRTWNELDAEGHKLHECEPHQTTLRQPDGRSCRIVRHKTKLPQRPSPKNKPQRQPN